MWSTARGTRSSIARSRSNSSGPTPPGMRRFATVFSGRPVSQLLISHPGVATLFEAGETGSDGEDGVTQLYLASELVTGHNLEAELSKGPMPVDRVIDTGVQLAEALSAAHKLGIVHRDIKPSNLMITPDGRVKVLDFGVAKRVEWAGGPGDDAETLTYTARGAIVGTPAYMAPEQVGGGIADARTDVHGAGCVLYQMLSGKTPFGTGSPSDVMRRVIVSPPTSLKTLRAGVAASAGGCHRKGPRARIRPTAISLPTSSRLHCGKQRPRPECGVRSRISGPSRRPGPRWLPFWLSLW